MSEACKVGRWEELAKLKKACVVCREVGADDEQLLLVKVGLLEEMIREIEMLEKLLDGINKLDRLRKQIGDKLEETDGGAE